MRKVSWETYRKEISDIFESPFLEVHEKLIKACEYAQSIELKAALPKAKSNKS
jgi:hypothetical protein